MDDEKKNEVDEFADYIFDYWRMAHTPLPNLSAKEMAKLGESFTEGLLEGLRGETEDGRTDEAGHLQDSGD